MLEKKYVYQYTNNNKVITIVILIWINQTKNYKIAVLLKHNFQNLGEKNFQNLKNTRSFGFYVELVNKQEQKFPARKKKQFSKYLSGLIKWILKNIPHVTTTVIQSLSIMYLVVKSMGSRFSIWCS